MTRISQRSRATQRQNSPPSRCTLALQLWPHIAAFLRVLIAQCSRLFSRQPTIPMLQCGLQLLVCLTFLRTQYTINDRNTPHYTRSTPELFMPTHFFPVYALLCTHCLLTTCHRQSPAHTPADVFSFGMLLWQLFTDCDLQTVLPTICSQRGTVDEPCVRVSAGASWPRGRAPVGVRD